MGTWAYVHIGKTIERIVACRLNTVISDFSLADNFQSAYKSRYSTESAPLRVQNDILCAMDKGHLTALILLDLSAAFDTMDHTILLKRLRDIIGLQGTALKWCKFYLREIILIFKGQKLDGNLWMYMYFSFHEWIYF